MIKSYFRHVIQSIPLLPLIYFQGIKLKKGIKLLPAAKDPQGFVNINSPRNVKILFIGESSFAGVGVERHKNGFAGYFSQELSKLYQTNIEWKVYAKVGFNTKKIQQEILPLIREKFFDLVVIGIGGNDTFEMTTPKVFRRNAQILIDDLQKKYSETPILFVQLPTIEAFHAFTKQMKWVLGNHKDILAHHLNKQVLQNKNVYFPLEKINKEEWLGKLEKGQTISEFFSDGIHPSELCYDLWAKDGVKFLSTTNFKFK